jgi:hypothetical protein
VFNVLSKPQKKSFKCDKDAIAEDLRAIARQVIEDMVSQSQMLQLISQLNRQCTLMRRRRGSTRGYAPSEDLETGVRRSGATDRRADGATTRALQLPL